MAGDRPAPRIALIDCGRGNLRSVEKALAAVGAKPERTSDPRTVAAADMVVVPGQGAFADAMSALRERGLDQAIVEAIESGRPYLGICLGLQLLFDESDEHGTVAGLGVIGGRVERLASSSGLKIPHVGWNRVAITRPDPVVGELACGDHFYFVHSYVAVPADPAVEVLRCHYGADLCAAIRVDNIFACQFHPEKSQAAGLELLSRFVGGGRA